MEAAVADFSQRVGSCTLPIFALALSDATSLLGVRIVLRRVNKTKRYWTSRAGRCFLMCATPSALQGQAHAATLLGKLLIVDTGFREVFETGCMTPRYR